MRRVIGIDPGTVSIDLCGIDDGRVFLDRSLNTSEALADPSSVIGVLEAARPLDLVAGPSGYGLPLTSARDLSENDLRLAFLAPAGESGGIGGLRSLVRSLGRLSVPVVLTPGVVHLPSVAPHRKVNRVDMGTADKVCAAALAVDDQARRRGCTLRETSFILLELGGAFTAAIAVDEGQIVDGIGGSAGPLGMRASGALDGEVAYLAGRVTKQLIFQGGAASVAGDSTITLEGLVEAASRTARGATAWSAFLESAVKAVAALAVSVPRPREIILSGRGALVGSVRDEIVRRTNRTLPETAVHVLTGFAATAGQAAQGAALIADGLAGGRSTGLVDTLGIRAASGTVLDNLYVIDPSTARNRLGMD